MIVVTGAAGFIGSCMVSKLNSEGFKDIVLVDDFSDSEQNKNFEQKQFTAQVNREDFIPWIDENHKFIQFIFHMGARSATSGYSKEVYDHLNLEYTKSVWNKCVVYGLPLVYASSAATYGMGEHGFDDSHEIVSKLVPLNLYGESKNDFDKWALMQKEKPYFWAGLKFFNVYGPNEYHKGRMASVILHAFNQISQTNKMKLFRSHHPDFKDGGQTRDFVYVKDVTAVMYFLMNHRKDSGLYNIGTGIGRSFLDLTLNTFKAMQKTADIEFIDTPMDIREKYQYFTEANISKLRSIGYLDQLYSLEDGVADYVTNYLKHKNYL